MRKKVYALILIWISSMYDNSLIRIIFILNIGNEWLYGGERNSDKNSCGGNKLK